MSSEPIDAVYTWVDGSDRAFRRRRECFRPAGEGDSHAFAPPRFYDNQELRFSLRSLERYAPWIRRVHLVTDGQLPRWLDTSNPRLRVIDHETLFPDRSVLPIFNSRAIEWQLSRIPGLSRRFVYFNDDVILGRRLIPEDLTSESGQRIFVEHFDIPPSRDAHHETDRGEAFTLSLLDRRFGTQSSRRKIAHIPHLLELSMLEELGRIWPEEIARTMTHRFRSGDDVSLPTLYSHYLTRRNSLDVVQASADPLLYIFVGLFPPVTRVIRRLLGVLRHRPRFFCINDELENASGLDSWMIRKTVRIFLGCYFAGRSSFEKGARRVPSLGTQSSRANS